MAHSWDRKFVATAALLVLLAGAVGATPHAIEGSLQKLRPELQVALEASGAGEMVGFIAILASQADAQTLRIEAARQAHAAGRAAARSHVRAELMALSARTQSNALDLLKHAEAAGQVSEYRGLWIGNAITGRARPAVIYALAALPEIDRILWSPLISAEQQTDEVIPPGGRRYVPARLGESTERTVGWNLEQIGAPDVWAKGYTGDGAVVALIDTGVDYTHPDLANRMWLNDDEIPFNGIDDDTNGFIDDTLGWDFVMNDNDPMGTGTSDHGTRAAGIVAGDGTSGIATGVAPGAQIMALRASGGGWDNLFEAIEYACDNGADIISMSVTQKWHFVPKPDYAFWRQVTDAEVALGLFHANSIGNIGDDLDLDPIPFNIAVPGSNPSPWISPDQHSPGGVSAIVAVGAVDSLGILSDFSSRGPFAWEDIGAVWPEYPHTVPELYRDYPYSGGREGLIKPDLLAPGEDVLSTQQGGGYLGFTGTSASCPHVAGAMALLLEILPEITPAEMTLILELSATDLGTAGKDNDYGAGLLNVLAASDLLASLGDLVLIHGAVFDSTTGDSLAYAEVEILEMGLSDTANESGIYKLYTTPGQYTLEFRCFGYLSDTVSVSTIPGEDLELSLGLNPGPRSGLSGVVADVSSGAPIVGARIEVPETPLAHVWTDSAGSFSFPNFPANLPLTLRAVHFGHLYNDSLIEVPDSSDLVVDFALCPAVHDEFEIDQGWVVGDSSDTALAGWWVRCDPTGILLGQTPVQPEDDHTPDPGIFCYVTGNGVPGASEHQNDVDGGWTTLTSPRFDGAYYYEPNICFSLWYSNDATYFVDDTLRIEVSNDDGATWAALYTSTLSRPEWVQYTFSLTEVIGLTNQMRFRVIAADTGEESSVEVALDDFRLEGIPYAGIEQPRDVLSLSFAGPLMNPLRPGGQFAFRLAMPGDARVELFDLNGRRVRVLGDRMLSAGAHRIAWDGTDSSGRPSPAGVYFARLMVGQNSTAARRVVFLR